MNLQSWTNLDMSDVNTLPNWKGKRINTTPFGEDCRRAYPPPSPFNKRCLPLPACLASGICKEFRGGREERPFRPTEIQPAQEPATKTTRWETMAVLSVWESLGLKSTGVGVLMIFFGLAQQALVLGGKCWENMIIKKSYVWVEKIYSWSQNRKLTLVRSLLFLNFSFTAFTHCCLYCQFPC